MWDVTFQTAVAQAEQEARDYPGHYHRVAFHRLGGEKVYIETTRPELVPSVCALIAHPDRIEAILLAGAEKARRLSAPFIRELRSAVGLRALNQQTQASAARQEKAALPAFKQYREKDGQFYFKLTDPKGRVLLQSTGFTSPRDAGQVIARLQSEGPATLDGLAGHLAPLPDVARADVEQALQALCDAARE